MVYAIHKVVDRWLHLLVEEGTSMRNVVAGMVDDWIEAVGVAMLVHIQVMVVTLVTDEVMVVLTD